MIYPLSTFTSGKKIYLANIGTYQIGDRWIDFVNPTEVTIVEDRIDFRDITKFKPETDGFAGGEFTFKTDNHFQYTLDILKTDDLTKPDVSVDDKLLIGTDLDDVIQRFELAIEKEWNRTKSKYQESFESFRQVLRDTDNIFSEKYPEKLI